MFRIKYKNLFTNLKLMGYRKKILDIILTELDTPNFNKKFYKIIHDSGKKHEIYRFIERSKEIYNDRIVPKIVRMKEYYNFMKRDKGNRFYGKCVEKFLYTFLVWRIYKKRNIEGLVEFYEDFEEMIRKLNRGYATRSVLVYKREEDIEKVYSLKMYDLIKGYYTFLANYKLYGGYYKIIPRKNGMLENEFSLSFYPIIIRRGNLYGNERIVQIKNINSGFPEFISNSPKTLNKTGLRKIYNKYPVIIDEYISASLNLISLLEKKFNTFIYGISSPMDRFYDKVFDIYSELNNKKVPEVILEILTLKYINDTKRDVFFIEKSKVSFDDLYVWSLDLDYINKAFKKIVLIKIKSS